LESNLPGEDRLAPLNDAEVQLGSQVESEPAIVTTTELRSDPHLLEVAQRRVSDHGRERLVHRRVERFGERSERLRRNATLDNVGHLRQHNPELTCCAPSSSPSLPEGRA
jgi:hypothetical protein